jgi:hypothetical protein
VDSLVNLKYRDWYVLKSTSQKQLELEINPVREYLEHYVKVNAAFKPEETAKLNNFQTAKYAQTLIEKAKDELNNRRVQDAWALFYAAQLEQYKLLNNDEIAAQAGIILYQCAPSLDDGAKQNIRRLISKASQDGKWILKDNPSLSDVIEARRIVQNYYNEKYTYLGITLEQLSLLAGIVIVLTVGTIFMVTRIPDNFANTTVLFWLTIGLFGAIGGSISGLLGLQQAFSSTSDMPQKVLNKWITIAKPIIGFSAAIVIAVFITAGLVKIADIEIGNYLMYGMAFISGFSERLIIGVVEARLTA